ncbi:MAG: hypothetical protein EXS16_04620 [Gemmataceae bacterium]|nr:hypothetical protein [Gemmataceae bacterium]
MSLSRKWMFAIAPAIGAGLLIAVDAAFGQQPVGAKADETQVLVSKAIDFLKTTQGKDGAFSAKFAGPGITAIVVAGLVRNGVSPEEPVIANALKFLEAKAQKDGGIYDKALANYSTSVAIMAFKESNTKGRYDSVIKSAGEFIKKIQNDEEETHLNFGGFGYDKKSRPDMSNTGFSVEALLAAGLSKDDPVVQRALKFISRCQNLPGETNDQPFAKKTTDDDKGGLVYNPAPGEKNAHTTAAGGLRSVGGMTYSGLKSFLYAGVKKDDPRVKAAVTWVRNHYTLDENPGMGKAGLYYYYHTFAKAMDALGDDIFVDGKGAKHDWRRELFNALQKQQLANGSWRNMGERTFGEDNAELATGFALLSLSYTKSPKR